PLLVAAPEVVEREVVALLEQCRLGALDDGSVEPSVEEGDDDADVPHPTRREGGGARRDDVAQLVGGLAHVLTRRRGDVALTGERAGHRRGGDAGAPRDLLDARHGTSLAGAPILSAWYGVPPRPGILVQAFSARASYPSGQRDLTVNQPA